MTPARRPTPSFVLDASATIAWVFDEEGLGEVIGALIRDGVPVVPPLWHLEIANAILVKERRRVVSPAEAIRLLGLLDDLGVQVVGDPIGRSALSIAATARPLGLSSYDAVYLELAVSLAVPLLTTDRALGEAAARMGVPLLDGRSANN